MENISVYDKTVIKNLKYENMEIEEIFTIIST